MIRDEREETTRYIVLDRRRQRLIGLSFRELTLLTLLALQVAVMIACRKDGTWTMASPAVGLSRHYGFSVIFAVTPLLLLLTSYILEQFVSLLRDIDTFCVTANGELRRKVVRLAEQHIARLSLRGESASILTFVMLSFLFWVVWNITHTIDPRPTYHHDVFDAWAHPYGFIAAKAYVAFALSVVWAITVFVTTNVTYSMISILGFLAQNDALQVNLFHSDNCGGTSRFGDINLAITSVYVALFAVVFAMFATHGTTYVVIWAGLFGCIALVFAQTIGAVYSIHKVVKIKKDESLAAIVAAMNTRVDPFTQPSAFPSDLLAFRNHVLLLHTFPYAKGTVAMINVLRFAPVVIAVITFARALAS